MSDISGSDAHDDDDVETNVRAPLVVSTAHKTRSSSPKKKQVIPMQMNMPWEEEEEPSHWLIWGLAASITLLVAMMGFCCADGNNVAAIFCAIYLYFCVYVITLQLLPRNWGRSVKEAGYSGRDVADLCMHQRQELCKLNQYAVLMALVLPIASFICAAYRLVGDHSLGNIAMFVCVSGTLLLLFAWSPSYILRKAPESESEEAMTAILEVFMKPSAAMSKLLGLGKKDKWEWSWIPKDKVLYAKAGCWFLVALIVAFMWIYSHWRHCVEKDSLMNQLCSVACMFIEVLGTSPAPPPKPSTLSVLPTEG
uniref:Uncharacterized protein n=1 Tax=Eutreptiella gymnastica TaxID=73025 RepID=A0A7S4LI95_9EUGL